jgi:hypothetical protein
MLNPLAWARDEVSRHPARSLVLAPLAVFGGVSAVLQILEAAHGLYLIVGVFVILLAAVGLLARDGAQSRTISQLRSDLTATTVGNGDSQRLTARLAAARQVLELAAEGASKTNYTENVTLHFVIGTDDSGDELRWVYETRADSAADPVRWRTVEMAGPPVSGGLDVASLRITADSGRAHYVPLKEDPNDLRLFVAFNPPITDAVRRWEISYKWPGQWAPLRQHLRDEYEMYISHRTVAHIALTFEFPSTVANPRFELEPSEGNSESDTSPIGRPWLCWRASSPTPGSYRLLLAVDGFS